MPESLNHLPTGFQNEIQTLENSALKDQPHLRNTLCPAGFPFVDPSYPVFPDVDFLTPCESGRSPNSMFWLVITSNKSYLALTCFIQFVFHCSTSAFSDSMWSVSVCLSSMKLLPLHPAHVHIPHSYKLHVILSPTISCVWSACPEAGSDHPSRNAFRCWNRWHPPMSVREGLLGRTS